MRDDGRIFGSIQENAMGLTRVYQGVLWDFPDLMLSLVFATLPCGSETRPKKKKYHINCSFFGSPGLVKDNLHYRLIFHLGKSRRKNDIFGKNLSKVVKFHNLVAKCCKIPEMSPCEVRKFSMFLCYVWKCYHF